MLRAGLFSALPFLTWTAAAHTEPPTTSPALPTAPNEVAREVVTAAGAGNTAALRAIANGEVPDVWEVVDELLGLGARAEAERLAEQVEDQADKRALAMALDAGSQREADRVLRAGFARALAFEGAARTVALRAILDAQRAPGAPVMLLEARAALELARAAEVLDGSAGGETAWVEAFSRASSVGWVRAKLEALLGQARSLRASDGVEAAREAGEVLGHAEFLARPHKDWRVTGHVYRELGNWLTAAGKPATAFGEYVDAALVFQRVGALAREAECLTLAGSVALESGDLAKSLDLHRRAATLAHQAEDAGVLQDVRINTAALFEMSGQIEQALEILSDVLAEAMDEQRGSKVNAAICLGNRARARFLADQVDAALADIDASQTLFEELEEPEGIWLCMTERGWYQSSGKVEDASVAVLRAELERSGSLMSGRRRAIFHEVIGRCEGQRGRTSEALAAFESAVNLVEDSSIEQEATLRADLYGQRGWIYSRAGRDKEALDDVGRYLDGLLGRVDGLECASSRTFRGIVAGEALQAGVQSALRLGSLDRAWRVLEAGRGIRLLASLGGRSRLDDLLLPDEVKLEIRRMQELELEARVALSDAQHPPYTTEQRAKLKAARSAVDKAVQARQQAAARLSEARRHLPLGDLGGSASLESMESVRSRLAPGHIVVAYSLSTPPPDVLAIVLERGTPARTVLLRDRDRILTASRHLRDVASRDRAGLTPDEAGALSGELGTTLGLLRKSLIDPLKLPAGLKALTVIPDGPLSLVPYAALFVEGDVTVTLQTSGTLMVALEGSTTRRGVDRLAVGVSDYSGRALGADMSIAASFAPPGSRGGVMRLRPLHFAAKEALTVAGRKEWALLDSQATAQGLLEALTRLQGVPLMSIHFACHGLVHADLPTLSGLALSDGMLTSQEILPWQLTTDMVVLSACDTATDPYVSGEGMTGLVRAFLMARSPRVIASLWKVPDEPTFELMLEFYRLLAADSKLAPSAALRAAQSHVRSLHGGKWASPENWAAWTLWGAP